MSESIFSTTADQADVVPPSVTPTAPVNSRPEFAEYVGEGKKYKTVEDALASIAHSQNHISDLEKETAELRAELQGRKTASELIEEFKSSKPSVATTTETVDPDTIAKLVEQVVSKKEAEKSALSNLKSVVESFKSVFGTDAEANYNKLAAENGMSVAQFNQLASQAPAMILKLAGLSKTPAFPAQPGKIASDVNTTTIPSNTTTEMNAKVANFSKTADVVDAWKRSGEITRKKLGL